MPVLRPDETCWRTARADELALLVDAQAYFEVLAEALPLARRSVTILGWDLHSQLLLRRGSPDAPRLGELLRRLASRRGGPEVHVLVWDWAMIFASEREFLPVLNLGVRGHRRVHFRQDGRHPAGASHHQKIVVIDDSLAFCGGIDLTVHRWDTQRHEARSGGRVDHEGEPYGPVHDVQVAVSGPAAAALGELARARWERATGRALPRPPPSRCWPPGLAPALRGATVGIARTDPGPDGTLGVREVERLHLAAIRAARRTIYVENQYLTSSAIGAALAERLREPDGPEVVLVLPRTASGWLEEQTMGLLRQRLLAGLRDADRGGRLRVYHPRTGHGAEAADVFVHSKLLAVDDTLLVAGSANLSNRSMGLDTECCVAVEAGTSGDPVAALVTGVRDRLLAEHLGATQGAVAEAVSRRGSVGAAVEALRSDHGARTLVPLADGVEHDAALLSPEAVSLVDPEGPIRVDSLLDEALPDAARGERGYLRAALVVAVVVALVVAWRATPLSSWIDPERLAALARPLADTWWGPLISVALFVVGSFLFVPFTILVVHAGLLHGPWVGFATAMAGGLASAAANFGVGHLTGRDLVRRLAGRRLNRISQRLSRRGVLTVVALRLVPVAPFSVVNMVAGASHVRLRDFLVGSALGFLPGVTALTALGDRLAAVFRDPTPGSMAFLAVLGLALLAGLAWLARLARRLERAPRDG